MPRASNTSVSTLRVAVTLLFPADPALVAAPTAVVVAAPGITDGTVEVAEFERLLQEQPSVAGVLGPGDQPLPFALGLFSAPGGGAVVRERMPELLATAGLPDATVSYAGDTALGLSLVDTAAADLGRVAIAVILVDLLLLIWFLRALVAPLYLLATSVLAVGTSLGVTTRFFQDVLGRDGLTFYVPFAAAVLLISLGSDYNIFSVGYIWEEARYRTLPEAVAVAVPRSTRAINAAGITLAASFALVALIPSGRSRSSHSPSPSVY